ncbi:hypothetical protein KGO95_03555 [Patescibacteria group bacterium]|nr:hypothetical protein [Patescibacteria group bacterium]
MHRHLLPFSKRQLLILWGAIIAFLAVSAIGAFAATDPNLQIGASTQQPPLCVWNQYGQQRIEGNQRQCSEQLMGTTRGAVGGYVYDRFGGQIAGGYRPEYCVISWLSLNPVDPGARGNTICPPLDAMVSLTATEDKVPEGGAFTINWSGPTASQCMLSGNEPDTGNFSQNFDGTTGVIRGSKTYTYVKRGVYDFNFACKGYVDNSKSTAQGTITRSLTIYVGNIPPPPTVTLTVDKDTITDGQSATLTWTSTNATAVSINNGIGIVAAQGSTKVSPKFTTRYTITAAGEFSQLGLAQYSATVKVVAAPTGPTAPPPVEAPPPTPVATTTQVVQPVVGLTVNGQKGPLTMQVPATVTLAWQANQYCLVYGSWLGIRTNAGQEQHTLTSPGTYTYNMYCPGLGSDSVKVIMTGSGGAAVPMPTAEATISTDGKTFTRSVHITRGVPTHVWLSAAYDANRDGHVSQDATGGWTGLMSAGGHCDWNYDLNQGTPTFDVAIPNPVAVQDCTVDLGTLTFFDQPGVYAYGVLRLVQSDGKVSNISSINVAVDAPPAPTSAPVITMSVNGMQNQATLAAPAAYTLQWKATNATGCTASDDWSGSKFPTGSQDFYASAKKDLTYTLTCVGQLGTTTQSMLVTVADLPTCDFSAMPTTLNKASVFGQQSVLTWSCQFANSCAITPSIGVSAGTFGTARVSPTTTTTYTLTCQNLDGSSSFDQTIQVQ